MVAVMKARIVAPWLIGLMLGLGPSSAGAANEFLEFYKLGLTAVDAGDWEAAAEMMQKAIERQPEARAKVKKGLYFRRYIPYFYLGKARYESGDCRDALAAWSLAESQGVVARFPELEELNAGRASCEQQRTDLEFARQEAHRVIQRATVASADSRRSLEVLASSGQAVGSLPARQEKADRALAEARSRLNAGGNVLAEIEGAAAAADQARQEFDSIRREVEQQRNALSSRQEQLIADLEGLIESAKENLGASEYLKPYPRGVSRRRAAVQTVLEKAGSIDADLSTGELEALKSELETADSRLRSAVSPPPPELTSAAEAFLLGDYTAVLTILEASEFSSVRAASHAHLLNAAALFTLFYFEGGSQPELLERAREEVLYCRAADPSRLPPASVFSPRFITFFDSQQPDDAAAESDVLDEGR